VDVSGVRLQILCESLSTPSVTQQHHAQEHTHSTKRSTTQAERQTV
jgi:hypothetical protein